MFKPLFTKPEAKVTRPQFYELQEVNAFTPVTNAIVTHQREGTSGSSATRWGVTEDGDLVVQEASIIFGGAEMLREGFVEIDHDFKVSGELADFVAKWIESNGAMFEFPQGMDAQVAYIHIPGKGYYAAWYSPQKWLSVKRLSEAQLARLMDNEGHELVPNVRVTATSLFEKTVAQA